MDGANLFESIPLSEKKLVISKALREKASELYQVIIEMPNSRERALAITALEESLMWSNKGLSRSPDV